MRRGILEIGPISCFCVRNDYFFNERTADVVKTSFSGLWADGSELSSKLNILFVSVKLMTCNGDVVISKLHLCVNTKFSSE